MSEKPLIKMNANENYFLEEEWMRSIVKEAVDLIDIRRYPNIYEHETKKAIGEFQNVPPENIVLGNGSDEVIDCTLKSFMTPGDKLLIHSPTFGMYKFYAPLIGAITKEVSLKQDFTLDISSMLKAIDEKTKLVIICSPNNPTGNQFRVEDVAQIIEKSSAPVIIDEAYADLARYSVVDLLKDYRNMLVFKTFSKSFGLAGIRVGYGIASKENTERIKKAIPPFNVNSVALAAVRVILKERDHIKRKIEEAKAERNRLYQDLAKIEGLIPYSSETNFILMRLSPEYNAEEIVKKLEQQNIIVRYWGFEPLLRNCIRVSIGSREMNGMFLKALSEIMEGNA